MGFRAFEFERRFVRAGLLALASASVMAAAGSVLTVAAGPAAAVAANAPAAAAASAPQSGRPPAAKGAAASPSAGLPPGTEWAAWINRDIEIDLQDLPKSYSCDELWYKLHAILLAIGAREYMAITPYDCGKAAANGGRWPSLHLRFQTLRPVTGKDIRWANTRAIEKSVVLAPGEPKRLDPADCSLVKQLQGTLLAYLDVPVSTARFECSAPTSAHDFNLSVRILERWPETTSG